MACYLRNVDLNANGASPKWLPDRRAVSRLEKPLDAHGGVSDWVGHGTNCIGYRDFPRLPAGPSFREEKGWELNGERVERSYRLRNLSGLSNRRTAGNTL